MIQTKTLIIKCLGCMMIIKINDLLWMDLDTNNDFIFDKNEKSSNYYLIIIMKYMTVILIILKTKLSELIKMNLCISNLKNK